MINFLKLAITTVVLGLIFIDPAFANKFETISSGVNGSIKVKEEYLQIALYVAAGICWLAGILSIVTSHNNASYLNYATWKMSAVLWITTGTIFGALAFFMF